MRALKWARGIKCSTGLRRSAAHLSAYAEAIWEGERIGDKWAPSTPKRVRDEHSEIESLAWFLRSMARTAAWESGNALRQFKGLPPIPLRSGTRRKLFSGAQRREGTPQGKDTRNRERRNGRRHTRNKGGAAVTEKELAELDLAVARAEGMEGAEILPHEDPLSGILLADGHFQTRLACQSRGYLFEPTRDGAEAMRLLEKYRLTVGPPPTGEWGCYQYIGSASFGPTPAIAIARAVIALSKAKG